MAFFTGSFLLDLLGIITALAAVLYAYIIWSYQYWARRGIQYLKPTVPFGNFENPAKRTVPVGSDFARIYRQIRAKGWKHAGVYIITSAAWVIVDLDLIKHVLTKDFQHFTDRGGYYNERDDPLSCHLFAIGGLKWRNLRMKLTPTFTSGKMKAMFQTVIDCGIALEKYIKNLDNKKCVDIKEILGCFTTDVIGSCAFGLECNSFNEPDSPFRKYGKKVLEITALQNVKFVFCMNFPNLARSLRLCLTEKDVSDFFMKVVKDTVKYREENHQARKDFLQLLIDIKSSKDVPENEHMGDGKPLTMNEIAAQCFLFFVAGFETSSTTMAFALYELARHQDLQENVRKEITSVLAQRDNQITYDSLSELKYMKQVIDETLRMHPPVPFLARQCVEDYKVPNEHIVIKKGLNVFIPVLGIHHDEEYYKNPEVFEPERFNEENKAQRHNYTHLPFGEGPRICIGERFAIMQTKVGLTYILKNFRVTVNEKTHVPLKLDPQSFISTAEGGIWLNLEKL